MPPVLRLLLLSVVLWLASAAPTLHADPPVADNILAPHSAAEAWNVIRLATANVDLLLSEKRLPEIPIQISYCSPAIRTLPRVAPDPESIPQLEWQTERALTSVNAAATAAMQGNLFGVQSALTALRRVLDTSASHFPPATLSAEIFVCPVHAQTLAETAGATCPQCSLHLIARRIPYSSIYMKPGPSTLRITADPLPLLRGGALTQVTLRLAHADRSPVHPAELLVTHTVPLHVFAVDPALFDFQQPETTAGAEAGTYHFSFTPRNSAPYRLWVSLVPTTTAIQELQAIDLRAAEPGGTLKKATETLETSADGFRFTLTYTGGDRTPLRVNQARPLSIAVTDATGKPVTRLEPILGSYSSLVLIDETREHVAHLHPSGSAPVNPTDRGGPTIFFQLFAPRAGFVRLFCQVKIDGKPVVAPFDFVIEP